MQASTFIEQIPQGERVEHPVADGVISKVRFVDYVILIGRPVASYLNTEYLFYVFLVVCKRSRGKLLSAVIGATGPPLFLSFGMLVRVIRLIGPENRTPPINSDRRRPRQGAFIFYIDHTTIRYSIR